MSANNYTKMVRVSASWKMPLLHKQICIQEMLGECIFPAENANPAAYHAALHSRSTAGFFLSKITNARRVVP
ncbi:hypothetical protein CathTA2_2099 [Caldalkalibacillus thermarum TA2.A1]|uniref:Uncharacterized protein n=1 Tax=Caldalkalibacillus thermarum (strain TA2.A1) TaxID=986075 RepID=F5L8E7_CALTT|nr:hypothetical protein CathTA2_2099 [Caldalkalibacillus thermarum TA2.A1]